jgi:RNA polymerase sigma-70 factor, ECF subfamily
VTPGGRADFDCKTMSGPASERDIDPDPRREERALVERMLAGDEEAMAEFADGYFPGLLRFARSRLPGEPELARDLVQTTVCKALAKLATFRGEAPLSTWLCACCHNEIRMHFRRKATLPRVVELDADVDEGAAADLLPSPGEHPEGALARKEEARRVHAALDLLPPRYARALEWKYLDRLSVQEIAARLRLGGKAAESLLGRARRAFRQGFEQVGARGIRAVGAARELEP